MKSFLILMTILFISEAQAQVVLAPYAYDNPLINPAAGFSRRTRAASLQLTRQIEKAKDQSIDSFLEIQESSETTVDRLAFQGILGKKNAFFELTLGPQRGTKLSKSQTQRSFLSTSSTEESQTEDELNLVISQIAFGFQFSDLISLGAKYYYSAAGYSTNIDTTESFTGLGGQQGIYTQTGTREEDSSFNALGLGAVVHIPKSPVYLAYGLDKITFTRESINNLVNKTVFESGSADVESTDLSQFTVKPSVKKTSFGVGFLLGKPAQNSLKIELSRENLPFIDTSENQTFGSAGGGTLNRIIIEGATKSFSLGFEFTRITGFYIDFMNLLPYYFELDRVSDTERDDISFFGSLSSKRGLSYGLVVKYSEETLEFTSSSEGSTHSTRTVDIETLTFGLKFAFVF